MFGENIFSLLASLSVGIIQIEIGIAIEIEAYDDWT